MEIKYGYKIDLNVNSTASKVIKMVGKNKKVLEFGCSYGYMSEVLKYEFNCEVTGIEIDEEAAQKAKKVCHQVFTGDVEKLDLDNLLKNESYDVIIFADVLEHLVNPWAIIDKVSKFLSDEGYIVASIPNISYGGVVLNLLYGNFQYQNLGILDNTHLRFFTKESIIELFESNGYYISTLERTKVPFHLSEFQNIDYTKNRDFLELNKKYNSEYDTYQYIVKAKKMNEVNAFKELEVKYQKNKEFEKKYNLVCNQNDELEKYVLKLEKDILEIQTYSKYIQTEFEKLQNYNNKLEKDFKEVKEFSIKSQKDLTEVTEYAHKLEKDISILKQHIKD